MRGCAGRVRCARWPGRRTSRIRRGRRRCRRTDRCRDRITSSTDGSWRAISRASSSAARASLEKALCRAGRLNRMCSVLPSRSATTGSGRTGAVAGPRCCSHAANSPPDCSVEYASDSVIDPRQRGRGRIDRPQHVVTHGGGLRPHLDAGGQLGDRGRDRLDGDDAVVGDRVLAQGEGRVLDPRLGGRRTRYRRRIRPPRAPRSAGGRTGRQVAEVNDEHGRHGATPGRRTR